MTTLCIEVGLGTNLISNDKAHSAVEALEL